MVWLKFNAKLSRRGPRSQEVGKEGSIPNATLSPPGDSCIKIGSDENHFNVSLIVRAKSQNSV